MASHTSIDTFGISEEFLERADVMVVALDTDGEVTFINRKGRELLGYDRGELVGRSWFETCLPDRISEETRTVFDQLVTGEVEAVERYENPVVTKQGEKLRIEWHNSVIRDENGEVEGTLSSGSDITAQREREQDIRAARKRYETLLHASPDPVFVADVDTGEIIEANEAAERFRGQPRDEILGLHQTDLHPAEDTGRYRRLFEGHREEGGTKRRLPDGSQIYAVTASGERIPVEISVGTVELDRGPVMYGVFHDISEQLTYEQMLTGLNDATRNLFAATTPSRIGKQVVDIVTDVLDLSGVVVYLFDETDGVLRPIAHDPPTDTDDVRPPPVFEPGESIAWDAFITGESAVYDDVRADERVYNQNTAIRSEIVVPIGDHGVIIVGDTREGVFDGRVVDLVEVLGATTEAALDRAERGQQLETRRKQLERQTDQLKEIESINSQIRDIARTIVQSETTSEIEKAVCAQLVDADLFSFAWIGGVDPIDNCVRPRAWAGDGADYLDHVSLSLDQTGEAEPAVRAVDTQQPVTVTNTAVNTATHAWRSEAIERQFRSVMSVPLVYEDALQGVLSVYATASSAFSERLRSVLSELGKLIAHAFVAIERKQAVLADEMIELEFSIQDRNCVLYRLTHRTDCALEVEFIRPRADQPSIVCVSITDGSVEDVLSATESIAAVENTRVIETNDVPHVQFEFVEPVIAEVLADQGIAVHDIHADQTGCALTVAVPTTADTRQVVDTVATIYPNSELRAKREEKTSHDRSTTLTDRIYESFTDRQLEVIRAAYLGGYFESPREMSGQELASEFHISAAAFHQHLRTAERKILESLFHDEADLTSRNPDFLSE